MTPATEFEGSCLCGKIRYRILGTPLNFFHCHCQRCRKSSGTGHASNIIVKPETAEWIAGESELRSYKVPNAKRFKSSYCRSCGSPMPRLAPDLSVAVIPAGSLDSDPPLRPTGRIFWEDRADWSCAAGSTPAWPQYPRKD